MVTVFQTTVPELLSEFYPRAFSGPRGHVDRKPRVGFHRSRPPATGLGTEILVAYNQGGQVR
jgi:hypothetical protein